MAQRGRGSRANAAQACGRIKVGSAQPTYNTPSMGKVKRDFSPQPYCSFAYSALACFEMGMSGSGSASF
jgi:hypothetical protein